MSNWEKGPSGTWQTYRKKKTSFGDAFAVFFGVVFWLVVLLAIFVG